MAVPSRWTCPSEDALYRFSTGDASRWRRARLQRHLDRCAACAARLDGWEATTAAYRDYVNGAAGGGGLAEGVNVSASVCVSESRNCDGDGAGAGDADGVERARARIARFEARLRREPSLTSPPSPALVWSRQVLRPIGWRSIAAAIVLVAGGLFGFLPIQETITADALVARAVANDRECPCPRADMVTIAASPQRGNAHAVPVGIAAGNSASRGLMSERGAHARELAERLAEYAFDWQAPLSARPYQEWRSAITARTESYDWIASDRVRVSTHAASGRIARAELILRTTDYRPVGQTWLFADGFAVELRLFERDAPAAPSPTPPSLNRIAATGAASVAPAPRTIEETEIALRLSLERAGVALTRRLTLRQGDERLTITGRAASRDVRRIAASAQEIGGINVEVRAEARRQAAGPPDVREGFDASGSRASSGGAWNGSASSPAVPAGFEAWLDRTFGGSRSRAAFLPVARELRDDYADAVSALDGLSQRFPASAADPRLSARARNDVRWLTAAYYTRVAASYERLEAHLAPLTGSVSRRVLTTTPPSHWRTTSAVITPPMRALSAELAILGSASSSAAASSAGATADDFERTVGVTLRDRLVAVVPR